jgi:hypothetical protein
MKLLKKERKKREQKEEDEDNFRTCTAGRESLS